MRLINPIGRNKRRKTTCVQAEKKEEIVTLAVPVRIGYSLLTETEKLVIVSIAIASLLSQHWKRIESFPADHIAGITCNLLAENAMHHAQINLIGLHPVFRLLNGGVN